jgi:hypothetical protein
MTVDGEREQDIQEVQVPLNAYVEIGVETATDPDTAPEPTTEVVGGTTRLVVEHDGKVIINQPLDPPPA